MTDATCVTFGECLGLDLAISFSFLMLGDEKSKRTDLHFELRGKVLDILLPNLSSVKSSNDLRRIPRNVTSTYKSIITNYYFNCSQDQICNKYFPFWETRKFVLLLKKLQKNSC